MIKVNHQLLTCIVFILAAVAFREAIGQCATDPLCANCVTGATCPHGQCKSFNGLNFATNKCEACSLQANCFQCTNTSRCTQCTNATFGPNIGSPGCGLCAPNCANCAAVGAGKCTPGRCASGYFMDATGACIQCSQSGCAVCNATDCSGCKTGFSLILTPAPASCIQCAPNCAFCRTSGAGNCDFGRCSTLYGSTTATNPSQCELCTAADCNKCDTNSTTGVSPSSGKCGTCKPGFTLQPDFTCTAAPCTTIPNCNVCFPNTLRCTNCTAPYGVDTVVGDCKLCTDKAGCSRCDNLTLCTRCTNIDTDGPKMDGSGTCGPCGTDCIDCSVNGAGKCDNCKEGFWVATSTKTCKACTVLNCGKCPSDPTCASCASGFTFNAAKTACDSCAKNCTFCFLNGAGKCDAQKYCNAGYTFNAGTMQCDPAATTTVAQPTTVAQTTVVQTTVAPTTPPPQCLAIPNCLDCHVSTSECITCEIGYGVTADKQCAECNKAAGCSRCQNVSMCTQCTALDGEGPTMDLTGGCGPCDPNCLQCSVNGATFCDTDKCDPGYFLDTTKKCTKCVFPNCGSCPAPGTTCTSCIANFGFTADKSACQACAPFCSFCNVNLPTKCDAQRYCETGTVFNAGTKVCDGTPVTTAGPTGQTTVSGGTTVGGTTVGGTTAAVTTPAVTTPAVTTPPAGSSTTVQSTGPTTPPPACLSIQNCLDCHVDPNVCIKCDISFGIDSANQCSSCNTAAGCSRCTKVSQCTQCSILDRTGPLSDGSGGCGPCASNCLECPTNNASFCDTDKCDQGYYLDASKKCIKCGITNCSKCATPTTCDQCMAGFTFNSTIVKTTCYACGLYCSNCFRNGKGVCDGQASCTGGTTFNSATLQCINPNATTTPPSGTTLVPVTTTGPVVTGPTTTGPLITGPTTSGVPVGPATTGPVVTGTGSTPGTTGAPGTGTTTVGLPTAAVPGTTTVSGPTATVPGTTGGTAVTTGAVTNGTSAGPVGSTTMGSVGSTTMGTMVTSTPGVVVTTGGLVETTTGPSPIVTTTPAAPSSSTTVVGPSSSTSTPAGPSSGSSAGPSSSSVAPPTTTPASPVTTGSNTGGTNNRNLLLYILLPVGIAVGAAALGCFIYICSRGSPFGGFGGAPPMMPPPVYAQPMPQPAPMIVQARPRIEQPIVRTRYVEARPRRTAVRYRPDYGGRFGGGFGGGYGRIM